MTDLERCIKDCGTDAPLYTVPSKRHPKSMRAVITTNAEDLHDSPTLAIKVIDLRAGTWYTRDGKSNLDLLPDIAPVMPTPGSRWVTAAGDDGEVFERGGGLWFRRRRDKAEWGINEWGHHWGAGTECDLVLPYFEPALPEAMPTPELEQQRQDLLDEADRVNPRIMQATDEQIEAEHRKRTRPKRIETNTRLLSANGDFGDYRAKWLAELIEDVRADEREGGSR